MSDIDAAGSLEGLPDSLQLLARRGVVKHFERGAVLIREGEREDTIFIILAGAVKVFSTDERGREFIYGHYGAGEYIGEMSLDGGPRSASVATLEPTRCAIVTRHRLCEHIREQPDFALELIKRIIGRVRLVTENARGLALLDSYARLIRLLDTLAVPDPAGVRAIAPKPTHADLAGRIGSSREMVTRLLKDLERGGYVSSTAEHLLVLKRLPSGW